MSTTKNEEEFIHIDHHNTPKKRPSPLRESLKFFGEILLDAVIIIGLVVIIRTYVIAPFQVHGTSMCNSLNYSNGVCNSGYGEYLIISKFAYIIGEPQRGDIVVFRPPGTIKYGKFESLIKTLFHVDGQEFFIKRVIGLPGDTIDLKNGYVYITNAEHPNGYKLDEPYLSSANQGNTQPLIPGKTKFVVPAGRYLVFGDNRVVSTDARSCFRSSLGSGCQFEGDSYIGTENIEGRASLILFPLNKMGFIKNPHTTN
jgi:signal peptidase I